MYLAFDIGIKNLAYCLISNSEDNKAKIIDWGIIDLTDSIKSNYDKTCCFLNCKQTAKFCNLTNKSLKYCGIHCKKIDKDKLIDLKKIPCYKENCKQIAKFYDPLTKLYACTRHSKDFSGEKVEIFQKKATNIPLLTLSRLLFKKMEEYPLFLEATDIIIENQPVLKNPTMKSIQMILYSFFISKETVSKKFNNISLLSASNKLKVYKGEIDDSIKKIKNKYNMNKKMAIEHCRLMLEEECSLNNIESKWLDFFNNYKDKRDDLSDAYLMCRYYINKL